MTYEVTDRQRHSYNAAFYELGLRWHWDTATFGELRAIEDREQRLRHYMEKHQPHMLAVYDCSFLSQAIEKARAALLEDGAGMHEGQFDWTEFQRPPVGV